MKLPEYRKIREFTNEELIACLIHNDILPADCLGSVSSEVLRRMNEKVKLLPKEEIDWGSPLTP